MARSDEQDERYEGCLSFFDVRGLVPRPLRIVVESTTLTGELITREYRDAIARLIQHEIDHLDDILYTSRMRAGIKPIPVEQYRQTGQTWSYVREFREHLGGLRCRVAHEFRRRFVRLGPVGAERYGLDVSGLTGRPIRRR